jgi:hypothetical protein
MPSYRHLINTEWEEAARRLVVEFEPETLRRRARLHGRNAGYEVTVTAHGWTATPLRFLVSWAVSGWDDASDTTALQTGYRIGFEPVGPRLVVCDRRYARSNQGDLRPAPVGDEEFDLRHAVFGDDPDAVRGFLTPERRKVAAELIAAFPPAGLRESSLTVFRPQRDDLADEVVATVLALIEYARRFRRG